jgi:hypothetical protein
LPPIQRTNPEAPGKIASKYEEGILTVYFAEEADAEWLCDLLNRLDAPLGTRAELGPDRTLTLHPFTEMTGSSRATTLNGSLRR